MELLLGGLIAGCFGLLTVTLQFWLPAASPRARRRQHLLKDLELYNATPEDMPGRWSLGKQIERSLAEHIRLVEPERDTDAGEALAYRGSGDAIAGRGARWIFAVSGFVFFVSVSLINSTSAFDSDGRITSDPDLLQIMSLSLYLVSSAMIAGTVLQVIVRAVTSLRKRKKA